MAAEPAREQSPIAGFWRRLAAFLVDGLIVGVPALIIGLMLFQWAASLGQAGKLLGFAVVLLYFGLLDSRVGGGQTVGKRLLGIRVTDRMGMALSPMRTIVRTLVIAVPWFLNGLFFAVDVTTAGWPVYLLGSLLICIVFGGLGSAAYLIVFNRRTRQSSQDLAVGSFVIRNQAASVPPGLVTPRLHLIAAGCWLALTLVAPPVGVLMLRQSSMGASLQPLSALQATLGKQQGVGPVKVTMGSTTFVSAKTGATTTTILRVDAQLESSREDLDTLMVTIAGTVLELHPDLLGSQIMVVRVQRGFNFGIASWSEASEEAHDAAAWRSRLARTAAGPAKI